MWVFGYGSLMWDPWETELGCLRRVPATLRGYRRTFNKASVKNWGTKNAPCPTLNLEQNEAAACRGVAFEFSDDREDEVLSYLHDREGKGFELPKLPIRLDDGSEIEAYVPLYEGGNLLPAVSTRDKAVMVRSAGGSRGRCADYVRGIAEKLSALGIEDPAVTELWHEIQSQQSAPSKQTAVRWRNARHYLVLALVIAGAWYGCTSRFVDARTPPAALLTCIRIG